MLLRLAGVLCLLLAVSACTTGTAAAGLPDGTSVRTISVGGVDRSYRVYKPAGTSGSEPLIVMLHGGFGTAEQAERAYGWNQLADSAKFVVAYPDGIGRAWNVRGCCGQAASNSIDDVGFITEMVDEIGKNVDIDPSRVYATGISNGGMMSYTLACNSDVFAAIGPDSATQLDPCDSPHPTSVMHVHGTADRLIPYSGGPGAGVAHVGGPSVPDLNEFWRSVDQCGAPTKTTAGPVTTSAATCAYNRSVVLMTVEGGGHEWPAFATEKLWQFFAAHPRCVTEGLHAIWGKCPQS
jgi:polyhydroxybutyrate depolymerase